MIITAVPLAGAGPLSNRHDFQVVNNFARHTGWLHPVLIGYAKDGLVWFAVLLVAGWWIARRRGQPRLMAAAVSAGIATLVAVGVNQPIVNHVAEKRPYLLMPHALLLVGRSADFSFPSDHAVMAGAVAAGLLLVYRRLGLLALLSALLMAFARVYVGAHWPDDVLAGLILGIAVALVGFLILDRPLTWLVSRGQHTPLRPLLASARRPTDGGDIPAVREQAGPSTGERGRPA